MKRARILAGVGSIAFSVLTFAALTVGNNPGGNYRASDAADYIATGHLPAVLVSTLLALLGVLGLIYLLAYLREAISAAPNNQLAANAFWGSGLAAAASFAVGWGVLAAMPIGHAEGGGGVLIAPLVAYLISEMGVVIIFGPGAILMGFALIALMLASRGTLPVWLRWLTLILGVFGITSLAYFTSPALIIWGIVMGVWLIVAADRSGAAARTAQPSA